MALNNHLCLWVDKWRPKVFDKLDLHKDLNERLKKMCDANLQHLLFYGPPGSGKKTRVMALLRELFGPGVEKLRVEQKVSKIGRVPITTVVSNHHIEMNPSEAGHQDKVVIMGVIKDVAGSVPLDQAVNRPFKVIVLSDVDNLSKEAQHALRRTMEKYTSMCRLVLICNSTSKVIEPVRSRCLSIRVPAPTLEEVSGVLLNIAKEEGINLPQELSLKIATYSQRNLRRAILTFEGMKIKCYPFQPNQGIERPDWEEYLSIIIKGILDEQSIQRLMETRSRLYELLTHSIPPELLFKTMTIELLANMHTDKLKYEVAMCAAFYEHRMKIGSKPVYHFEAFVAKFMSLYKKSLLGLEDF